MSVIGCESGTESWEKRVVSAPAGELGAGDGEELKLIMGICGSFSFLGIACGFDVPVGETADPPMLIRTFKSIPVIHQQIYLLLWSFLSPLRSCVVPEIPSRLVLI